MNLLEQQRLEIEALKSKIKEQAEKISLQEKEIAKNEEKLASLEKLNHWYIEQLKLRQQKKFGVSFEKAGYFLIPQMAQMLPLLFTVLFKRQLLIILGQCTI